MKQTNKRINKFSQTCAIAESDQCASGNSEMPLLDEWGQGRFHRIRGHKPMELVLKDQGVFQKERKGKHSRRKKQQDRDEMDGRKVCWPAWAVLDGGRGGGGKPVCGST